MPRIFSVHLGKRAGVQNREGHLTRRDDLLLVRRSDAPKLNREVNGRYVRRFDFNVLVKAAADEKLDLDTAVLLTALAGRVVGNGLQLAKAVRRRKASKHTLWLSIRYSRTAVSRRSLRDLFIFVLPSDDA